jgi:hypothetical protein
MSEGAKLITFAGTLNDSRYDMTIGTDDALTLVLKSARTEIQYTGTNFPRIINIKIDNVVSPDHVIDNDGPEFNYFKVIQSFDPVTIGPNTVNISYTEPGTAFKMAGRINKNCQFSLFDENHQPLGGLIYFAFEFALI